MFSFNFSFEILIFFLIVMIYLLEIDFSKIMMIFLFSTLYQIEANELENIFVVTIDPFYWFFHWIVTPQKKSLSLACWDSAYIISKYSKNWIYLNVFRRIGTLRTLLTLVSPFRGPPSCLMDTEPLSWKPLSCLDSERYSSRSRLSWEWNSSEISTNVTKIYYSSGCSTNSSYFLKKLKKLKK